MAELLILVFGEDDNDRRAVAEIIKSIIPHAKVERRHRPMILGRDAHKSGKRRSMAEDIAVLQKNAKRGSSIVRVVVHRDCDDVEETHADEVESLNLELVRAGVDSPILAMPAWEIEAWWMLFPTALSKARPCWRKVDYSGLRVGSLKDAKERLRRDLRPTSQKLRNNCRDYSEIDSLKIAQFIKEDNLITGEARARCHSLDHFCSALESASKDAAKL